MKTSFFTKANILILSLLLLGNFVLYSCSTSSSIDVFNKTFIGTWLVEESSSEMYITSTNGEVRVRGMDYKDNERFDVKRVRWDASHLYGTFAMPSTHYEIDVILTIEDKNRLKCKFSGDSARVVYWKRK